MSGPPSVTSIFKDRMHPEFVIKAAHGAVSVDVNAVLKDGCFYMMMTSKSVKLTQFFLQLVSGKILMSYAADKPILAYIDIEYSRIKFVENAEKCGRFLHAIRFIKGRNYEEIFHPERVVVLEWFEILKRFCILSKFRELYVIKSMIGKGNFAKVYVSSHAISNNDYAVKVFDKKLILQDKFERQCLLYELAMMREVKHPNLLDISEIFEGDNNVYCLGKLYQGENLGRIIGDKSFAIDEQTVSTLAFRLLKALSYLESKNIIHRDIKPENVVFENKGSFDEPVLVDLGFATFQKDYKHLFSRCGTPGYVAPEVLNDREYDCRIDVFSLGIILYMMVTRTNPFDHATYDQLISNNLKGDIDFSPLHESRLVDPKLARFIQLMLTVDPAQRPFASELLEIYKKQFAGGAS